MDPALVEAARHDIYGALAKTSPSSTLPADAQDALLAQACAEACDVLGRWLASSSWEAFRPTAPAARRPLADAIADWEQMRPFLAPVRETLSRISGQESGDGAPADPEVYIDELIKSATFTARRHRRLSRQDLYQDAGDRLRKLQEQACEIASEFRAATAKRESGEKRHERWRLARKVLGTVATTLLGITLAMAGASPAAVHANMPAWGHDTVQVLFVHHVAHTAVPTVSIAPPRLGPRVK
jgi:hypothetical protein